jgi:hypothetical protein
MKTNDLPFNRVTRITAEKISTFEKFSAVDNVEYLRQNEVDRDIVFFYGATVLLTRCGKLH